MPASILDPIKEYADTHAEPLSAIVSEALAAYLAREIRRECPRCGTVNDEDSLACKHCARPLTIEAEDRIRELNISVLDGVLNNPEIFDLLKDLRQKAKEGEGPRPIAEDQATLIPEPEQT